MLERDRRKPSWTEIVVILVVIAIVVGVAWLVLGQTTQEVLMTVSQPV